MIERVNPQQWREAMQTWALPESILRAAPESPWGFPDRAVPIASGAARSRERSPTATVARSRPCRSEAPCSTSASAAARRRCRSIRRCSRIIGVDSSRRHARRVSTPGAASRGQRCAPSRARGRRSQRERRSPMSSSATTSPTTSPTSRRSSMALTEHARRRVVMEITSRHPTAWMADLWLRFHGARPPDPARCQTTPCRSCAASVCTFAGTRALQARGAGGFERREDAVAWIRRRLCLDAGRDAEVAAALGARLVHEDGLWAVRPPAEPVVTDLVGREPRAQRDRGAE